jgi:Arc/MetJ family transcription regulator
MRTTVNLDQGLVEEAQQLTGVKEKALLLREGLKALIERESARRLAALGGSESEIRSARRRRSPTA